MAALRAGDADLAAPAGHAQLLAALGAAVIVIILALLEPHLLLAKPRGNAVLVGEILERYLRFSLYRLRVLRLKMRK